MRRRRSRAYVVVALVVTTCSLASSWPVGSARAQDDPEGTRATEPQADTSAREPSAPPSGDGPFEFGLSLENDNLLLGTWADIAGLPADGSDLGRTHASSLWIAYDLADRVLLRFDASSQLFTRSLTVDRPQLGMTIPVVFREIDRFRLGVGLGAPNAAWRIRLGFAVEIINHEHITAGATGQQRAWHDLAFGEFHSGWDMRHQSDGRGVSGGVSGDARFGARTHVPITDWLRLDGRGFAGVQLHTFFAGSALLAEGRIALTFGSPREVRFVVALAQDAYAWLASPGIMVRSTIELRLDLRFAALCVELNRYDGDQNEGYYAYVFANTTMTVSLLGRF